MDVRRLNKKSIFLLDGVGALVSALSLGIVLPAIQSWIGMPLKVLYLLATLALFFAAYSFTRYKFADLSNPVWLKGIIALNLSYCALSLFFVVTHFGLLTGLGLTYFILEKVIVIVIVGLELRILKRSY